jgi:preprotein translocase SecE subunit
VANKMADKKRTTSRSQMAEQKTRGSEKVQSARSVKTKEPVTREERKEQPKKEPPKQEKKPVRRDSRPSSSNLVTRLRSNSIGRFIYEAYYELLHKVTWPTFEQARNMTVAVILISGVIGLLLGLVDLGLYQLFLHIVGR